MLKLGVLVSGSGTNLQAILDAIADGSLDANVEVVISNKAGVKALERAEKSGIASRTIPHREFESRDAFDAALVDALKGVGVEWIVLAGFMRILTPTFLDAFPWRVINIHPALLPSFPGVDAQRQAIEYGVRVTGCTVHLVDPGTDTGPILDQRAIHVDPDDDADSLRTRLLREEHALLVDVLRNLSSGSLEIVEGNGEARTRAILRPG